MDTDATGHIKIPDGLKTKGVIAKDAPEIVQVVCLETCLVDDALNPGGTLEFEEDYKYYMTPPEAEALIQTGNFHAWNVGRWRIPGKSRNSKLA
jgi:hypothetical protein